MVGTSLGGLSHSKGASSWGRVSTVGGAKEMRSERSQGRSHADLGLCGLFSEGTWLWFGAERTGVS